MQWEKKLNPSTQRWEMWGRKDSMWSISYLVSTEYNESIQCCVWSETNPEKLEIVAKFKQKRI